MTLKEAVKILNLVKHQDYDEWYASSYGYAEGDEDISLTTFEAIAVAEKYLRESREKIDSVSDRLKANAMTDEEIDELVK